MCKGSASLSGGVSTHVVKASTAAQEILSSLADLATEGYRAKYVTKADRNHRSSCAAVNGCPQRCGNHGLHNPARERTDLTRGLLRRTHGGTEGRALDAHPGATSVRLRCRDLGKSSCLSQRLRPGPDVSCCHTCQAGNGSSFQTSMKKLAEDLGPSLANLRDAVSSLEAAERR